MFLHFSTRARLSGCCVLDKSYFCYHATPDNSATLFSSAHLFTMEWFTILIFFCGKLKRGKISFCCLCFDRLLFFEFEIHFFFPKMEFYCFDKLFTTNSDGRFFKYFILLLWMEKNITVYAKNEKMISKKFASGFLSSRILKFVPFTINLPTIFHKLFLFRNSKW